jgi:hypothetical protein
MLKRHLPRAAAAMPAVLRNHLRGRDGPDDLIHRGRSLTLRRTAKLFSSLVGSQPLHRWPVSSLMDCSAFLAASSDGKCTFCAASKGPGDIDGDGCWFYSVAIASYNLPLLTTELFSSTRSGVADHLRLRDITIVFVESSV